jgi:hypothetical protein
MTPPVLMVMSRCRTCDIRLGCPDYKAQVPYGQDPCPRRAPAADRFLVEEA